MTLKLDELDRLLAECTPGEWSHEVSQMSPTTGKSGWDITAHPGFVPVVHTTCARQDDDEKPCRCFADAALIAALRNAAPELIQAARERDALKVAHRCDVCTFVEDEMVFVCKRCFHKLDRERDAARAEVARMREELTRSRASERNALNHADTLFEKLNQRLDADAITDRLRQAAATRDEAIRWLRQLRGEVNGGDFPGCDAFLARCGR